MIEVEQQKVPEIWNTTAVPYPAHVCVHALFEAQAEQTPEAVAVVFGDRYLTYRELNQRANQLAHYLCGAGIGPETLVGICMERSLEIIVAILAVFKSGGAYIPLDPAYPAERLTFMLADSQAPLLLTHKQVQTSRFNTATPVLHIDSAWETIAKEPCANLVSMTTPDNLAYAIYTSGSTGYPKGVLVPHRGLCNLATVQAQALNVQPNSRILQFASFGFDASLWDILMALLTGATLYITPPEARGPGPALVRLLRDHEITIATLPPSVLAVLSPEELPALTTIVSTGEACASGVVARWLAAPHGTHRRFLNGYGPTETTVGATIGECVADERRPSIGRPFANMQVYLLDAAMNPVPLGTPGEVYVGGVGVARGYLNQPALTAEKFVPNPFSAQPGTRLYSTGDLALARPDGTLEFVDRVDRQIKIHGFRIELGEIETVLQQHPAVRESAVLVREDIPGSKRLVAYFVQRLDNDSIQEQVMQWQTLSDETYRERSANQDPTLNFVGWNSSYDGLPLPEPAIRELVEHTANRIRALEPKRMLEIGCGSGMLLFRIAPHCEEYWASDFSAEALHYLRQQLQRPEHHLPHVSLLHRPADDFTDLAPHSFDVVAINSVVQYFPRIDYLLHVLEGAVQVVKPGGRIFIGDVRNKDLLLAFHTAVQLQRAPDTASVKQLQRRVQKDVALEEELVVAPDFFYALQRHLPRISRVEMQLKRGRFHNEFTQFRYDVTLHIESPSRQASEIKHIDWQQHGLTLRALRQQLTEMEPQRLLVTDVPNPRLAEVACTLQLLADGEDAATVSELRTAAQLSCDCFGVEPEDIWSLSAEFPYTVSIMWSDPAAGTSYDILFERHTLHQQEELLPFVEPAESVAFLEQLEGDRFSQPWSSYANRPAPRQLTQSLIPELRQHMQERLPAHMVPSAFVLLDEMPHTINGKVHHAALPAPELTRPELSGMFVAPRDAIELQLVQIWEEVLQLRPIGITDNFFDLGGHSILAVQLLSQIQDVFGQELPLSTLSHETTIEQLAAVLRQPSRVGPRSPLVRIQRGGAKRPLFCVHPVGGSVLSYADLSRHLDPEQPIYGLHLAEVDKSAITPQTVEDLASQYIGHIRRVQEEGPYLLAGWSFGGLVAFEIARQLQAQGQRIDLLALFDTWAPLPGNFMADYTDDITPFTFFAKDLERRFMQRLPVLSDSAVRHLDADARLRYLLKLTQIVTEMSLDYGIDQIRRQLEIYKANLRAVDTYLPEGIYPYQITLFQAKEPFSSKTPTVTLGWNQLASEPVNVYTVPGNHLTMFSEPHILTLAERLQHCLDHVHARDGAYTASLTTLNVD